MKKIIGEGAESVSELTQPCPECDGSGKVVYSCCGDDIKDNDIDLCPTCFEHCGMDEETCECCDGTGEI